MKYSIVICCFNGSKYIDRCIKSLKKQTYKNFEILFINDGSNDDSLDKIKKYEKFKKLNIISQTNKGLSASRNLGIQKSTGDYILFLDVDDTLEYNTLEIINKKNKNEDLIKFGYNYIYPEYIEKVKTNYPTKKISNEDAFNILVESKIVFEMAAIYAFKKSFLLENKLEFEVGRYHEDYGLIPYTILKSKSIKLINNNLYNYYQTDDSITRNDDYNKTLKKANDMFFHTINMNEKVKLLNIKEETKKLFYSYTTNGVLLTSNKLNKKDKKIFYKQIKEHELINNLLCNNLKRKIKRIIWKIKINNII